MSTAINIEGRFGIDISEVQARACGPEKWQRAVRRACSMFSDMELVRKRLGIAEWTLGIVGKPYLHALRKNALRKCSHEEIRATLSTIPKQIGAFYLHFPYCTKHCAHCHYYKTTKGAEDEWQRFPSLLVRETELLFESFGFENVEADTVHLGGGTPSLIGSKAWMQLFQRLSILLNLDRAREIAIEVDPFDLTKEHLEFWQLTGVNRISLGVQSFDDDVLRKMNRQHDGEMAMLAVELVSNSDITNLNIDLMYGMPERELASWQNDLDIICDLKPRSVTCYATRPDPENRLADAFRFPSEAERLIGHQMAVDQLLTAGYIQYSPNQFITDYSGACLAKNNRNRCMDVVGVGPHAHSIFQGWFYENMSGVDNYIQSIEEGRLGPLKGQQIDTEEARRRFMQFGIKLSGLRKPVLDNGVSRAGYLSEFGADPVSEFQSSVGVLTGLDLLEPNEARGSLALTHEGVLLVDDVVKAFAVDRIASDIPS